MHSSVFTPHHRILITVGSERFMLGERFLFSKNILAVNEGFIGTAAGNSQASLHVCLLTEKQKPPHWVYISIIISRMIKAYNRHAE